MLKIICLSFITICFSNIVHAQKNFNVTVKLDSSINPKKVQYQYYNGEDLTILPDTFGNGRVVVFKDKFYSQLASISIGYTDTANNYYYNDFFISDKPAEIDFYCKPNPDNKLLYKFIKNATPIYDATTNKVWVGLNSYLTDTVTNKDTNAFKAFNPNHEDLTKNDSLNRVFHKLYKSYLNTVTTFLRKYPDDYFTFWYFINQMAQPEGFLKKDTAYLKEQLDYIKTVFPPKFTGSIEGKTLIKRYEETLNPPKLNEIAPAFTITTIDGKEISLKGLKGKYVLLDFWATWCPPCLAAIPFIKDIRKNYAPEKLEIIGMSADHDIKPLKEGITKHGMSWPQFYDHQKEMSRLYGINLFPTIVLIDPEGKLIYRSDDKQNGEVTLLKVLEHLN